MEVLDPATGRPLPSDAIQRVLFIANSVHVYNIPPMTPGKGHVAASWTADDGKRQIFTARVRVIETAIPATEDGGDEKVKTDIALEDASNGSLFAAAPYTAVAVVEPVSDSSRFFALRVQDEAGRKATLGIGFEERSEAFDFGVSLQEAQKTLGWAGTAGKKPAAVERKDSAEKRDLSLKDGETITINLPGRFGRRKPEPPPKFSNDDALSSFSLPPPPGGGSGILPPPPPAATSARAKRLSAQKLGFDDGKFGEFA
ncbi:DUF1681-domain-containing protein [Annulohypoxylon maeteangense]|uniref:DUF1681-domain-containing protein n=1 Tax=Annulohypoxylon maeteangense TaxID=1927788 RepID=UPI0020089F2E|nr:DUF1681-domain-containing protein [Annulohypoxylon maeteangense]KAI0888866.1 DUF1681-domain-containing protein [Annulohypoxylon maeteangense]